MDLFSSHLRLSEINTLVSEVISDAFHESFWIAAEVASISSSGPAGHTYLDLVEKRGDEILAQAKGQIWRTRRETVLQFERITRRRLERGMQILFLGRPTFHPRYGFSIEIRELDPNFTLGNMARLRQEVIERLAVAGLFDRNREVEFSPAPQRIAVISSATAAGWDDFARRLEQNPDGFAFCPQLFSALMQGDTAETSILAALAEIRRSADDFDCVLILRGGGATVDLSCFDGYKLASKIAEFPLPVICGIGHERDTSVCDMVAYCSTPTPTAAAEYLIARVREFDDELLSLLEALAEEARLLMERSQSDLQQLIGRAAALAQGGLAAASAELLEEARVASEFARVVLNRRTNELAALAARVEMLPGLLLQRTELDLSLVEKALAAAARRTIETLEMELQTLDRDIQRADPADLLRRGYSITHLNGRILRDFSEAADGDRIQTVLHRGKLVSIVISAHGPKADEDERDTNG